MSEQKVHGRPGIQPQLLCRDPNISPTAKVVFSLLTTYETAYPGQKWLAEHAGCSIPTLNLALKELELYGWILRERRNRKEGETTLYHVFLDGPIPLEQRPEWAKQVLQGIEEGLSKRDLLKNIKLNRLSKSRLEESSRSTRQDKDKEKNKEQDIYSPVSSKPGPPAPQTAPSRQPSHNGKFSPEAHDVLDALNTITGHRYQHKETSLKNIQARLKEGYTKDDCLAVIRFKTEEWGDDPTMAQYLRPQTLFAPSHFPGYLAAAKAWIARGSPPLKKKEYAGLHYENEGDWSVYEEAIKRNQQKLKEKLGLTNGSQG